MWAEQVNLLFLSLSISVQGVEGTAFKQYVECLQERNEGVVVGEILFQQFHQVTGQVYLWVYSILRRELLDKPNQI